MLSKKSFCVGLFLFTLIGAVQSLDCLDAEGVSVAWWVQIKTPQAVKKISHLYYDSTDDQTGQTSFRLKPHEADAVGTALYNTLDQLNHISRSSISILAFNDEFPNGKTFSNNAHAKGVIAYDLQTDTGFYIMHSTPKFPTIDDSIVSPKIPSTGKIYGQHYICTTIDHQGLHSLLNGLAVSRPNVYYDNGNLKPANSNDHTHTETIQIRMNHQKIIHLSKSPKHLDYFYSSVVSPFFNVNLSVESWNHPLEPPQCDGAHSCVNIQHVKFDPDVCWTIYQDHSKWAISDEGNRNVACFADINRAKSQNKRGGGALCFDNNSHIYFALRSLVTDYDTCKMSFLPFF